MTNYIFTPPERPSLPVRGLSARFPVRRIFCVGRNYAEHVREMGRDPDRNPPFFFTKPSDALVQNGSTIPYPAATGNLQHEIELVAAIGTAGANISEQDALSHVMGYAVGNDLTRRDLQTQARDDGRPWDTGKAFDASAPMTEILRSEEIGHPQSGEIWLDVDGERKQEGDLAQLIWKLDEIVAACSRLWRLEPGDLIMTGTPAGIGPVTAGQTMTGGIAGFPVLTTTIGPAI
ncbi:fumarylacetoacetate hydrolase family protein [Chelativorans oligotrophicus]|jgi:fumarylpyruvate hydrolase|uniref:Fumarylacetoacetate (FAA) hydrolase n=1 Tax=Chelativorans sp. (strain BNC1) TaxID=266779 RepID=Q11MB6_CHESB|nr:fumarylacetoacetate hydrolase family protein [Chelativorans oligotrophicus]